MLAVQVAFRPSDSVARNTGEEWYGAGAMIAPHQVKTQSQGDHDSVYEDDHRLPFLSGSKTEFVKPQPKLDEKVRRRDNGGALGVRRSR